MYQLLNIGGFGIPLLFLFFIYFFSQSNYVASVCNHSKSCLIHSRPWTQIPKRIFVLRLQILEEFLLGIAATGNISFQSWMLREIKSLKQPKLLMHKFKRIGFIYFIILMIKEFIIIRNFLIKMKKCRRKINDEYDNSNYSYPNSCTSVTPTT